MKKIYAILLFICMLGIPAFSSHATFRENSGTTTKQSAITAPTTENTTQNVNADTAQGTKMYYHVRQGTTNPNPSFVATGETITLQNPSVQKHIFHGWFLDPKYETPAPATITGITGKGLHLYAKFEFMNLSLEWIKAKNVKTRALKISWSEVEKAQGYEVSISTSKKFNKKNTSTYTTKKTTYKAKKCKGKRLKSGKKYYMKVRAFAVDSTGGNAYGLWSIPARYTIYR